MVRMERRTILRTGPRRKSKSAFTLIELIFVMLLITLMTSFALPKVANVMGVNLRAGANQLAGYLQAAYDYSVLRHERIRVRFDLSKNSYWTETFDESPQVPLLDENSKIEESIKKFEAMEEDEKEVDLKRTKKVETGDLKEVSLPNAIRFKGVYTSAEGKTIEEGTPWIEFFPGGFVPKTIVYVANDSDQIYSIILTPLRGHSKVERGEVHADEI